MLQQAYYVIDFKDYLMCDFVKMLGQWPEIGFMTIL